VDGKNKPPTMPRRQAGGDLKTTCRKSLAVLAALNDIYGLIPEMDALIIVLFGH
jgi:hypothetical protein